MGNNEIMFIQISKNTFSHSNIYWSPPRCQTQGRAARHDGRVPGRVSSLLGETNVSKQLWNSVNDANRGSCEMLREARETQRETLNSRKCVAFLGTSSELHMVEYWCLQIRHSQTVTFSREMQSSRSSGDSRRHRFDLIWGQSVLPSYLASRWTISNTWHVWPSTAMLSSFYWHLHSNSPARMSFFFFAELGKYGVDKVTIQGNEVRGLF